MPTGGLVGIFPTIGLTPPKAVRGGTFCPPEGITGPGLTFEGGKPGP